MGYSTQFEGRNRKSRYVKLGVAENTNIARKSGCNEDDENAIKALQRASDENRCLRALLLCPKMTMGPIQPPRRCTSVHWLTH